MGAFSAAPNTKPPKELLPDTEKARKELKLLWISCGDADGLMGFSKRTHEYLEAEKVPHLFYVEKGGHDFKVWKNDLYWLSQLLFQPEPRVEGLPLPESMAGGSLEELVTRAWHSGKTLPVEIAKQYPPRRIQCIRNDTGYNVLIDIAHQCSFLYMWNVPPVLHQLGYRSVSSQASLDTVLDSAGQSRIRIPFDPANSIYPFGWYPNFKYNVVITQQGDPNAPEYTDAECQALIDFVSQGGGLYILGVPTGRGAAEKWSLNKLAERLGGRLTSQRTQYRSNQYAVLSVSDDWEVSDRDSEGRAIRARREFGKGRVVLSGSLEELRIERPRGQNPDAAQRTNYEEKNNALRQTMSWLCEEQTPVGGEPRLPQTMYGGGAIYPELEGGTEGMIIYYAPNLNKKLIDCVEVEFPKVTRQILEWLPSDPTDEPMYLILSAGGGGGWAVNAFRPKENGIISMDEMGLISIYAHELTHTLGGPSNAQGVKAGESPFDNQGEAHAGWYQGKIDALYQESLREASVKNCQNFFRSDKFRQLDIKRYKYDTAYEEEMGKGADWSKIWYIWQRLDDLYGPTWYPRWKHTQYTRWADEPRRRLTFEESIEDMSIAVGEDLFPFFIELNTSLDRKEMGKVRFAGEELSLPPADIPVIAPGKVRLEPIGDYRLPLGVTTGTLAEE